MKYKTGRLFNYLLMNYMEGGFDDQIILLLFFNEDEGKLVSRPIALARSEIYS